MKRIRVLIADDHRLFLEGIRLTLDSAEDIEVVAEAQSGSQVIPLLRRTQPDIVLMDLRMPDFDGVAFLEWVRRQHPTIKVVVLSGFAEPELIEAVLKRGASAYVVKSIDPRDLPSVIRQAVEGSVYQPIAVPEAARGSAAKAAGLTEREVGILTAVARGLSNDAIGKELWVAPQTVKFHLRNIYRKLGVANRTEAVRYAYAHGLVENPFYQVGSDVGSVGDSVSKER